MADQTINEKGEILVTTTDVSTVEERELQIREILLAILQEVRHTNIMLKEALEADSEPSEIEENVP